MKRGEGHARSNRSDGWDWAALVVAGTEEGGGGGEGGDRRQDEKADTKWYGRCRDSTKNLFVALPWRL